MFEMGQNVLYGTEGVCRIERIESMKVGGKKAHYYVLKPIFREGATIYVPMDNADLTGKMRPVLSKEEIDGMLCTVTEEEVGWIEDANERKIEYGRILVSGDRCHVVRLVRTLYLHQQELRSAGKHLRIGDDQLLRDAEKLLGDEFALVLQIPQREVPAYIRNRIEESA